MSARDELAQIIESVDEASGWDVSPDAYAMYGDAVLAAGYRKPRTITTAEELDALPTDSTVRSEQGGIWFKETSGAGCSWTEPGAQWWHWSKDIALPAVVLYEPEA